MAKFRKRPVVIDAFKWTPFSRRDGGPDQTEDPDWIVDAIKRGDVYCQGGDNPYLTIETLEGKMRANVGDWVIRGVKGEIYSCRDDIFLMTYEPADDELTGRGNPSVTVMAVRSEA
jgi:hypothetical protein